MMNDQDFEQFKQTVESALVTEKINEVEQLQRRNIIASLFNYLLLTKDYENVEYFLKHYVIDIFGDTHLLPIAFLDEVKHLNSNEIDNLMHDNFMKNGYLYHVTKTNNLDSILEKGLVSLNKRFNENMYEECIKVNECFNIILRKNHQKPTNLIEIPDHDQLYKSRFQSIYLSTNWAATFNLYGSSMELFRLFLDRLFLSIHLDSSCMELSQDKLRKRIIRGFKNFKYKKDELQLLLNFYDKHYEPINTENDSKEKAIIMIPNNNIEDGTKSSYIHHSYNDIVNDKTNFRYHYQHCYDIECSHNISPDGLIAITIGEDNSLKVHKKIK